MEKRLEDLISQADKLLDAVSEERRKANDQRVAAEVESSESECFNQTPVEPRESFYRKHPRIARFFTIAALFSVGAVVCMKLTAPPPIGRYEVVNGTVEMTRFTSSRTSYGGHVEVADVMLPDGRVVIARIDSGSEITKGTAVPVRVYEDGAIRLDHPL